MKGSRGVILCIFSFCSLSVFGQEREILWGHKVDHGGFGAVTFGSGYAGKEINYWYGIKGAWLIDHRFYVGGAGVMGLKPIGTDQTINSGGLLLGYKHNPRNLVHWVAELTSGTGNVWLNRSDSVDSFIVFEPALLLEVNLDRSLTANFGLSYRHMIGATPDYSGANLMVNFIAGYF